jgi:hypothetical protein
MSLFEFPSGPWVGFYVYSFEKNNRHRMDLALTFTGGRVSGTGSDDFGKFAIRGGYDAGTGECYWTKTYVGAHDVFYKGFKDGSKIWGLWELTIAKGGFTIWPVGSVTGDDAVETETVEMEQPVEAVGVVIQ